MQIGREMLDLNPPPCPDARELHSPLGLAGHGPAYLPLIRVRAAGLGPARTADNGPRRVALWLLFIIRASHFMFHNPFVMHAPESARGTVEWLTNAW
jgi:hypothetical protein